jgi:hypothetical protein
MARRKGGSGPGKLAGDFAEWPEKEPIRWRKACKMNELLSDKNEAERKSS